MLVCEHFASPTSGLSPDMEVIICIKLNADNTATLKITHYDFVSINPQCVGFLMVDG